MTTIDKKLQILESIDSLDQAQTDKVMDYIKSLMSSSEDVRQMLKREALKEIRQALGKGRKLNPSF